MGSKLAEDPFKRRQKSSRNKSPLLLPESYINRLSTQARVLNFEDKAKLKLEKRKKEREACQWLTDAFTKHREIGSEMRKRQYARDELCARQELDREARLEIRKNFVLDKAYQQIFEEKDRVQNFRAAKNFCETLKDREEQIAAKMSQENNMAGYDAQFLLGVIRDVDNYRDEEKEKCRILEGNRKKNAVNWCKQHNEVLQKRNQEKWENLRDGFFIDDEVQKEKEKLKEKIKREKEVIQNYKKCLDGQIVDKLLLLEMNQQLEDAEGERARLFNEAKRKMTSEHKKIVSERDKREADKRQVVADAMMMKRSDLEQKEADILQKAVNEAEDKAQEESKKKAYKQAEAQKAIDQFYQKEMALKQKKKYEDMLNDLRDKRCIDDLVDEIKTEEDSKQHKRSQLERDAQHVQMHQMQFRRTKDKSKEIEDLEDYLLQMKDLDEEEEIFQKYAQKEIEECEARGIDTHAMRKAARPGVECGKGPLFEKRGHIRPRYYAATWNPEDLTHINRKTDLADTKSRLGFLL